MHEWVERVFASIDELIRTLPVPPDHRELLRVHLGVGRDLAEANPELPAIRLPLLVHAAITGDEIPALPVAGACTLLYLGADLLDNLLDDELPSVWRRRDPAEAYLAATTLLAVAPQLSIARLREQGKPPGRLWELSHLFARSLLTMSAGEHEDLLFAGRTDVGPETCRAMTERKSGSELALFARAAAMLATEDPTTIEEYTSFGWCLGTAGQICSDVGDIWSEGTSRDLLNGKRTLPIVHALSTLRGEPRERLQGLLGAARESGEDHEEVRTLLAEAGSMQYTALVVEVYRHRACAHLAAASPREPAGRDLKGLVDAASLVVTGQETNDTSC